MLFDVCNAIVTAILHAIPEECGLFETSFLTNYRIYNINFREFKFDTTFLFIPPIFSKMKSMLSYKKVII